MEDGKKWHQRGEGGSVDRQTPHTKGIPPVEKDVLVYSCPFPPSSSLPNAILKKIPNHSHRIQLNCRFHLTTQNQIYRVLEVQIWANLANVVLHSSLTMRIFVSGRL